LVATTRLPKTPSTASTLLRVAEDCRRRGDLETARIAYRRSISLFLQCGFEVKAMAVRRALEGLRPPPPRPSRARWLAERVLLIVACALVALAARFATVVARSRAEEA